MKRKAYERLLKWKNSSNSAKAIIIKGARRVGKSYLAEEFAKNEYKSYILIDFSSLIPGTLDVFKKYGNKSSLDEFYNQLSVLYGVRLFAGRSVIIFDEVQKYPKARELVKHLVADGRFDIIETGSLISIKQNVKNIVIPSEEDEMLLHPMDFEEFLWALDDTVTIKLLRDAYFDRKPLYNMLKPVMDKFRLYMVVGGMPQAVLAYLKSRSYDDAETAKRGIIKLYRDDILKYAGKHVAEAASIFNSIPAMLSHHDKKIKFSALGAKTKSESYYNALFWISESMVGDLCYAVDQPDLLSGFSVIENKVKCYMSDTGLLLTHASGSNYLNSSIYKSLAAGKLSINKGMLTENIVAQMLRANDNGLNFIEKTQLDASGKRKKYEVDFILRDTDNKIILLEVKSGNTKQHSSLDYFSDKYKTRKSVILTKGDYREEGNYVYLPLPMAMFL